MKQFLKILRFELGGYFTNKVFVGVTVALVIVIVGVMFFPVVSDAVGEFFASEPTQEPGDGDVSGDDGAQVMLVSGDGADTVAAAFAEVFDGYRVDVADEDDARERVTNGEAECAFVLESPLSYTYLVRDLGLYDFNSDIADSTLVSLYQANVMASHGMDEASIGEVMSAAVTHETEALGVDQSQNYFYTYIMIMALYMVIMIYGQMVASNVASEKSSRAMELLITSASPTSMMFGKVIASCTAGLFQLVVVFGTAIVSYTVTRSHWDNPIVESIFGMPPALFGYMILFFLLGFLLFAFMYGVVGSMASKLEDLNTLVMPVTLIFVAAFIVVMISLGSGNVDTTLMRVCSFVPLTSPMSMFTRIAMSEVPVYEIIISVSLLAASVVGVGFAAAKIYRLGVLLYGTPPKFSAIVKALKK